MAARWIPDPRLIFCDNLNLFSPGVIVGYFLPGTVLPEEYAFMQFPGTGNHFPYGLNVEPDVHA